MYKTCYTAQELVACGVAQTGWLTHTVMPVNLATHVHGNVVQNTKAFDGYLECPGAIQLVPYPLAHNFCWIYQVIQDGIMYL